MGKKGKGIKGKVVVVGSTTVTTQKSSTAKDTQRKEEGTKQSKGSIDKKFEGINKQCELVVPLFYPIDNVVVNKYIFKNTDESLLKNFSKHIDEKTLERELIELDDFEFYLDHVNSVLEHILYIEFYEFHKNMIYNQSLKDFIKCFLRDIQKQGNIESNEVFNAKKGGKSETILIKFKKVMEVILKLMWRLVSNNTKTKNALEDPDQFTETYLGDLIFKVYNIDNFVDLVKVYGRSNPSVVHNILSRIGELSPDKFTSQFNDNLISSLKSIKNHVRSL